MEEIVVIGSSNTDLVIKTQRIPEPGETVLGGVFMMTAGGKGANQAVAAARLGGRTSFVARVGRDMFGERALENYAKDNLNTDFVFVDETVPSGTALITVDGQGENCIVVASGANGALCRRDIDAVRERIAKAKYVLMQLEVPIETVEYAAEVATAEGAKVILNPAPAAPLSSELMRRLYLITPNRTESQLLTGIAVKGWADAEKAADILLRAGVENVVITMGTMGSLLKNATQCVRVPSRRVAAVDTTAAGDVFNGALCVALSEGKSLVAALEFATAASSIAVTRMGAQTSIPTRAEVEALMHCVPAE